MKNPRLFLIAGLLLAGFGIGDQGVDDGERFVYSGFTGSNVTLSLDGTAVVTPSGLLELTNGTAQLSSHAVHRTPLA